MQSDFCYIIIFYLFIIYYVCHILLSENIFAIPPLISKVICSTTVMKYKTVSNMDAGVWGFIHKEYFLKNGSGI